MKKTLILLLSVFLLLVSCEPEILEPESFVTIPHQYYIAPKGESINITCEIDSGDNEATYQWYKSEDGSISNGVMIQDAVSATLSIPPFEDKGLYYFFCQVKIIYDDQEWINPESITVYSNVVTVAYTGLPTVYVDTDSEIDITSKSEWVDATLRIEGANTASWNTETPIVTEVKGRGNTTWELFQKKPFALKLGDKTKIMGLPKHKRWVLLANAADKTLLRNSLASYLSKTVFTNMAWTPSFHSVELVLNGDFRGSYIIGEQIKINDNRVNISKADKAFIVEINERLDEDFNYRTTHGVAISLKDYDDDTYPGKAGAIEFGENYVKPIIEHVEDVLFSDDYNNPFTGYSSVIDEDSFIDWYLINEISKNEDAKVFSSIYMYYKPSDNKIYMGPIWDFDLGFGNSSVTDCNNYTGLYVYYGCWLSRLFTDPVFKNRVKKRFFEIEDQFTNILENWTKQQAYDLSVSAEINFKIWDVLGKSNWPDARGYENRDTYKKEVDYLIEWTKNRLDWLSDEFASW